MEFWAASSIRLNSQPIAGDDASLDLPEAQLTHSVNSGRGWLDLRRFLTGA